MIECWKWFWDVNLTLFHLNPKSLATTWNKEQICLLERGFEKEKGYFLFFYKNPSD